MTGEKYLIATNDNALKISVRNILDPNGYTYLDLMSENISFIRAVRTFHPDFLMIDMEMKKSDAGCIIEIVDGEMLCSCILIGSYRDSSVLSIVENSNAVSYCLRPIQRELLLHTVEMANINFRRILGYTNKIKKITEDYESRKIVERAKCILMERNNLREKDAYDVIRKCSMDKRESMRATAEAIINEDNIIK